MRHRAFLLAIVGMTMGLGSFVALAQERQIGGVGLTIFADRHFRGRSATLRDDTPDLRSIGLNDAARSLRAGPGEQWEVCEHAGYRGRCVVVSGSEADLRRSDWDRTISSARRVRGGGGGIRPPIQPLPGGLELFSRTGFAGDRRAFTGAQPDLRRAGFNDLAQSVRIGARETWEVCVDANFRNCRVVNTDWENLSDLGMSRRISSVRPWPHGGGSGSGQMYIVLYDDRGYRGRSHRVDRASSVLLTFANRAESVQVMGGSWELCDRTGFSGRCAVVSSNVPDLASVGLRNRVASARAVPMPR
jgi:hypothetical protein